MKKYFSDKPLTYNGTQLHSHFAYESFHVQGDSIVSFAGPCAVTTEHMVDLEDVKQNKHIFSENMLHFIVEHFGAELSAVIAFQRLLIVNIMQEIAGQANGLRLVRKGDDIYDGLHKLSVSIATVSPVSCLIHTGINISSRNTPVPARGLQDYGLDPAVIATGVMNRYCDEIAGIQAARVKVRACP